MFLLGWFYPHHTQWASNDGLFKEPCALFESDVSRQGGHRVIKQTPFYRKALPSITQLKGPKMIFFWRLFWLMELDQFQMLISVFGRWNPILFKRELFKSRWWLQTYVCLLAIYCRKMKHKFDSGMFFKPGGKKTTNNSFTVHMYMYIFTRKIHVWYIYLHVVGTIICWELHHAPFELFKAPSSNSELFTLENLGPTTASTATQLFREDTFTPN